jgi:hypothetical protein
MGFLALPRYVAEGGPVRRARFTDHLNFICNVIMGNNTMPRKENYTEDMTAIAITDYQAGIPIEQIATAIGKNVRSVRSKLVREGVYVAQEKSVTSRKSQGPTKKELLLELERIAPFSVEGFQGATKEAITLLLNVYSEKDKNHGNA